MDNGNRNHPGSRHKQRRFTMSKPVIPTVEFELNTSEAKCEAEDTVSAVVRPRRTKGDGHVSTVDQFARDVMERNQSIPHIPYLSHEIIRDIYSSSITSSLILSLAKTIYLCCTEACDSARKNFSMTASISCICTSFCALSIVVLYAGISVRIQDILL